jgi:PBSX family phage portal protein
MADDVVKDDRPTAQVFRLVEFGGSRAAQVQKDLGPNGGQTPLGAVQPNAFEPEDEYQQLYVGATRDQGIIQPPYNLRQLDRLSQENNALGPCIEAMVINCDGTGYEFESTDAETEDDEDDDQIEEIESFFDEPWPGVSWGETRKLLRRDNERTGNAYIEVIRNPQDEIVLMRRVDSKMMRMLRLDDAIPVQMKVTRKGKEQTIQVMKRERRYCQLVNGVSLMYFKEFGSTRDLHKKTAVWAPAGQRLPANMRASEIIHLTVLPDAHTPYGVPRWVNQIPSVLGSRKAEEFNLEFFDNGGVPPIMILLQGGVLQTEARKSLEQKFSGEAKKNNRVAIIEAEPVGGSLNQSPPQARVTVERFGADRQADSMFEKYDERCEERVRRSFRLPPIFVGQSKDYNFATAFASYTVTEAQVFKPERDAFDEVITMRLLPVLGFQGYRQRSHPLVIEDPTLKLQGLEVIQGMANQVEPADLVEEVNLTCGLHLKVSDAAPDLQEQMDQQKQQQQMQTLAAMAGAQAGGAGVKAMSPQPKGPSMPTGPGGPTPSGGQPGALKPKKVPALVGMTGMGGKPGSGNGTPVASPTSKSDTVDVGSLAVRAMKALRKRDMEELAFSLSIVNSLDAAGRAQFNDVVGDLSFVDNSFDPQGLAELSACTLAVMSGHPHAHEH